MLINSNLHKLIELSNTAKDLGKPISMKFNSFREMTNVFFKIKNPSGLQIEKIKSELNLLKEKGIITLKVSNESDFFPIENKDKLKTKTLIELIFKAK